MLPAHALFCKTEISAIHVKGCDHEQICAIIDDWMDYYNNERYQWDLAKLAPNEYYEWLTTGVYPLGGKAPKLPEFTPFVYHESENADPESVVLEGEPANDTDQKRH